MEDSGTSSPGDRDERLDGLVRPYVIGTGKDARRPLDRPASPGEQTRSETGWFYPASLLDDPPPAPRPEPENRSFVAAHRREIWIGATTLIVVLISFGFLALPRSSPAILASKCQPSGCDQVAPPGTVLPLSAPATPGARPTAGHSTKPNPTAPVAVPAPVAEATTAPATTVTSASPRPKPTRAKPGLTPGSRISIRATTACCTTFYIQHDVGDDRVVITHLTSGSSAASKADATWVVRRGLADSSCISFESADEPGQYLRHFDFELYLQPNDGGSQFAQDATFCPRPGNSGQDTSFQSVNYPNMYIRHFDYVVYLASDGGPNPWDTPTLWPDDSTWAVSSPWG